MTQRLRNFSVGVVVLFALGVLAWMIFRFGAQPATFFRPPQMPVVFMADRADGLGDGSTINFRGVEAGRVLSVRRDAASDRVRVEGFVYRAPPLPANLKADIVFTSPLGGVSSLELRLVGPVAEGTLQPGAVLEARYLGSTFLPSEFAELARNLNEAVERFNSAQLIESLRLTLEATLKRLDDTGRLIDSVQQLVDDPRLREDLRTTLSNLRHASEEARQVTGKATALMDRLHTAVDNADQTVLAARDAVKTAERHVDRLGNQLSDQLARAGQLLGDVAEVTRKINQGAGTAGLLVNDPKLYEALVNTAADLNLTIRDLRRLIEQWEQEGITLRLGR